MSKLNKFSLITSGVVIIISCITMVMNYRTMQELNAAQEQNERLAALLEYGSGTAPILGPVAERRGVSSLDEYVPPATYVISNDCSEPAGSGEVIRDGEYYYFNPVITFTVPDGWSVWRCIEERFPGRGDSFVQGAIDNLQRYIDDKTLTVRDVNVVPVDYVFYMGGDGAGANPGKQ